MRQQQDGFTLAELLVVITIIGILAALVLPSIVTAIFQGNNVACQNNLGELFNNAQTYKSSNQGSPPPAMGGEASNWGMFLKDNGKGEGSLNNELFFCPVRGNMPKKREQLADQDGDYMYNVSSNGLNPLASAAEPDTILAGDCVSRDGTASSHGDPSKKKVNFLMKNSSVKSAGKGESLFKRALESNLVAGINTQNPACPIPSASEGTGQTSGQTSQPSSSNPANTSENTSGQ